MIDNKAIRLFAARRSQYALGKNVELSQEQLQQLIQEAIRQAPSAFNSQSSRAVILFGEQSEKFWDLTKEALRPMVPAAAFAGTENKLNSFAAGVGTVLFYEDQNVVKGLQEQFPLYADNFPIWSEHSTGIAQFAVWTALAAANIGASLQHYNPVVDEAAAKEWNVPESWVLRGQMPFGSNEGEFGAKEFMNDDDRFLIFS